MGTFTFIHTLFQPLQVNLCQLLPILSLTDLRGNYRNLLDHKGVGGEMGWDVHDGKLLQGSQHVGEIGDLIQQYLVQVFSQLSKESVTLRRVFFRSSFISYFLLHQGLMKRLKIAIHTCASVLGNFPQSDFGTMLHFPSQNTSLSPLSVVLSQGLSSIRGTRTEKILHSMSRWWRIPISRCLMQSVMYRMMETHMMNILNSMSSIWLVSYSYGVRFNILFTFCSLFSSYVILLRFPSIYLYNLRRFMLSATCFEIFLQQQSITQIKKSPLSSIAVRQNMKVSRMLQMTDS